MSRYANKHLRRRESKPESLQQQQKKSRKQPAVQKIKKDARMVVKDEQKKKSPDKETAVANRVASSKNCPWCPRTYSTRQNLRRHLRKSHRDKCVIKCQRCSVSFYSNRGLKFHSRICPKANVEVNPTPSSQVSPAVGKIKKEARMVDKDNQTIKKKKTKSAAGKDQRATSKNCPLCPQTFVYRQSLWFHLRNIHRDKCVNKCQRCSVPFFSERALKMHGKNCSKTKVNPAPPSQPSDNIKDAVVVEMDRHDELILDEAEPSSFCCEICQATFEDLTALNEHIGECLFVSPAVAKIKKEAQMEDDKDKQTMKKKKTKTSAAGKDQGANPKNCLFCPRTFVHRLGLWHHLRKSHREKCAVMCKNCSAPFYSKRSLKIHGKNCPNTNSAVNPTPPSPPSDKNAVVVVVEMNHRQAKLSFDEPKTFCCAICQEILEDFNTLMEHIDECPFLTKYDLRIMETLNNLSDRLDKSPELRKHLGF